MEYYSTIKKKKKKKLLMHPKTWLNLKGNLLSERSQTQKARYCMTVLDWYSGKGKSVCRDREQFSSCQGLDGGRGESTAKRYNGTFLGWWKYSTCLEYDGDYTRLYVFVKIHRIILLKTMSYISRNLPKKWFRNKVQFYNQCWNNWLTIGEK